jgi:hypothetical protein
MFENYYKERKWKYLIPIYGLFQIKNGDIEGKNKWYALNLFMSFLFIFLFLNDNKNTEKLESVKEIDKKEINKEIAIKSVPRILEFNATHEIEQNKTIKISGRTNLLKGTKLGIELLNDKISYRAQDFDIFIQDDSSFSSVFSYKNDIFPNGKYKYQILLYQNESWQTKEILEDLKIVKIKYSSDNVVFENSITINNSFEEVDFKNLAQSILQKTKQITAQGISMESLRQSRDDLPKCTNMMRKLMSETEILKNQAEKLPTEYIKIKVITGNADLCIRCTSTSLDYCKMAEADTKTLNAEYK